MSERAGSQREIAAETATWVCNDLSSPRPKCFESGNPRNFGRQATSEKE